MNTNELLTTIREALEFAGMTADAHGLGELGNDASKALAALDQLEAQQQRGLREFDGLRPCQTNRAECLTLQQQPKRLTDEEIKAEMMRYDESLEQNTNFDVTEVLRMGTAYGAGMRHARDSGYLGGLTVDEVMQVFDENHNAWVSAWMQTDRSFNRAEDLRARLTDKLQGQ